MKQLSALRKDILRVIEEAPRPLRALEVKRRIALHPSLSTIYRALAALENRGAIRSIGLPDGTRCYLAADRHAHFILCTECREIQTFRECGVDRVQKIVAKRFGYRISGHVLYFLGLCATCGRYLKKKEEAHHA